MPIDRRDYVTGRTVTQDVVYAPGVLDWCLKREHAHVFMDNRAKLRAAWGKPSFNFKSEFHFQIWVREHAGETFIVLSAKGKGTCIEIVRARSIDSKVEPIISFLNLLSTTLRVT